jgi:hypothetical protein
LICTGSIFESFMAFSAVGVERNCVRF